MTFQPKHSDQMVRRVVNLYRQGYGAISIAQITGVPMKTVRAWLLGRYRTNITGGRIMQGKRPGKKLAIYRRDSQCQNMTSRQ